MADTPRLGEAVECAENPEPRCPYVLLLDTSGSMQGAPIDALNQGLRMFQDDLLKDPLASRRVEVALVTFDSDVRTIPDFVTTDRFQSPILAAHGSTCMGSGIQKAMDMIQARKLQYRANGVSYYRPWVFMITDGAPTEAHEVVERAAQRLKDDEDTKRVAFFAVGVEGADMHRLSQIVVRTPVKLIGLNFAEMFLWLSASMSKVSQSKMDEQVALPPPGWGTI